MSEWIGRTVSKVEIQKLLGRGGMAEVYLGRHTTLNREVAVKVLQSHLSEDDDFLYRFRTEAQAVAAMRHPNIVQVYDFDVVDDRPYMVMELLEGPSLKDYLAVLRERGQILPLNVLARLFSSLAAALDYAHDRGIVHRDIKPANIMLRSGRGQIDPTVPLPADAEPVLTDFGVARVANATVQTASGQIIGTPAYMSPEQVQGKAVDARSDIYALGIVLYEMLTNKLPFDADTQAAILIRHLTEPVPLLPKEYTGLQPVVDQALAKEPTTRFQKASDLASHLSKLVSTSGDISLMSSSGIYSADAPDPSTLNLAKLANTGIDTPAGVSTEPQKPASTFGVKPLWLAAGGVILVSGISLAALAFSVSGGGRGIATPDITSPTSEVALVAIETGDSIKQEATPTPFPILAKPISGTAVFSGSSIQVSLKDLQAPPEGSVYEAWLTETDASPLSLGIIQVTNGEALVDFTNTEGDNLLDRYSGFAVSLESTSDSDPAMSDRMLGGAQIDPNTLQSLRLLREITQSDDLKTALLDGIVMEANHYDSHIGFAIDALKAGDLAGAKSHSEHIINIAVGQQGPEYGDWNENDRIENPGDGVGLRSYLLILKSIASGIVQSPESSEDARVAAGVVSDLGDELLQTVDEAVRLAERVSTADSIDVIGDMAGSMQGVIVKTDFTTLAEQAEALDLVLAIEVVPTEP